MTELVLASTTSVEDSGLFAHVLPQFTGKTGIAVRVTVQGTGQALEAAHRGDVDLVLVHDPEAEKKEAEKKFVADGDGLAPRQIAWNDFLIVGPSADPAHVKAGHDSIAALKAIDKAKVPFGTRSGENSRRLAVSPEGQKAIGDYRLGGEHLFNPSAASPR